MSKEAEFMGNQNGACGVSCGLCQVFKHEKYRCFGCEWVNRMLRKSRESKKGCTYRECTQDKKTECCFMCEEFLCQKHYDSKEAVYTNKFLTVGKN